MKLKSLLWLDFFLGFTTGAIGVLFSIFFEAFLKIPNAIIVLISTITLLYSFAALFLAIQKTVDVRLVKGLIFANWLWSFVSVVLLLRYFSHSSVFGKLYLGLQIVVVGGLAYFEGQALNREGSY